MGMAPRWRDDYSMEVDSTLRSMQQIVGPLPLGRVRDGEMDAQMVRRGDEGQGKSLTLALLFFISLAVTCHPRKRDARIGIENGLSAGTIRIHG